MEDLLSNLEPLLHNVYVHYGVAALGGLLVGWFLRGLTTRRPAAPATEAEPAVVAGQAASTGGDAPASGLALTELPGMTAPLAAKLAAAGVSTAGDMLSRCQDKDSLHALADAVQLEDFVVRKWVNAVDLLRLPGVTPALADALIRCGARNVTALAGENPDRIQHKLAAYEEKKNALGGAPDRAAVSKLIDAAAALNDPET